MAYNKTTYVDGITPLNARNLNNSENAIDQVSKDIASISNALVQVDDKANGKAPLVHRHTLQDIDDLENFQPYDDTEVRGLIDDVDISAVKSEVYNGDVEVEVVPNVMGRLNEVEDIVDAFDLTKANKSYVDDEFGKVNSQYENVANVELPKINSQLETKANKNDVVVTDYGAVGDNITDDTQCIKNAIKFAKDNSKNLILPSGFLFKVTETLSIPSNVSLICDSPIKFYGDSNAVIIGDNSNTIINKKYKLHIDRSVVTDWEQNITGVKIINANCCNIEVVSISNFDVGLECVGDNGGFAYSYIYLSSLMNNRIAVKLNSTNNGWVNDNSFCNGRFGSFSSIHPSKPRKGVVITSDYGYIANNNIFYKPSFELGNKLDESYPVDIEIGSYNSFYDCRLENNSPTSIKVANGSQNYFSSGYGIATIMDLTNSKTNYISSSRSRNLEAFNTTILNTGNLLNKIEQYNGTSSQYNISNISTCYASNGNLNLPYLTNCTIEDTCLSLTGTVMIGVYIDTTNAKQFVIQKDVISGYGGRCVVICFDDDGNRISTQNSVNSLDGYTFTYFSSFGGGFMVGSDYDVDTYITVSDSVKKILVGFTGGTNPLKIKSFLVKSTKSATCFNRYDILTNNGNYNIAASIPNSNSVKGKRVVDYNLTTKGWIYNTSWGVY